MERLRVSEDGRLRVIVTLGRPGAAGGAVAPPPDDVPAAKERVLAELDGTGSTVLRRYEGLPQLSLQVDEPGLCRLLAAPDVAGVQADVPEGPTRPEG